MTNDSKKESDNTIPDDISFEDAENYQGGNKNALTFPQIVANQVNRISLCDSELPSDNGDRFPQAVSQLAALLKNYANEEKYPDIVKEWRNAEKMIEQVKNDYNTKYENMKKNSWKYKTDITSTDINIWQINRMDALRNAYRILQSILIKLWEKESYFGEESARG